jgi:hypothetical protein
MLLSNIGGADINVLIEIENVKKDCELVMSMLMLEAARAKYKCMLNINSESDAINAKKNKKPLELKYHDVHNYVEKKYLIGIDKIFNKNNHNQNNDIDDSIPN